MYRRPRHLGGLALALGILAFSSASAQAVSVTLGSKDLSVQSGTDDCDGPSCFGAGFYTVTPSDPTSTMFTPADGTIVGWRVRGSVAGVGALRLHVIRPRPQGDFIGIGNSLNAVNLNGTTVNPASLDVLAGDSISVAAMASNGAGSSARLGYRSIAGGRCTSLLILGTGATAIPAPPADGCEYLYNADVSLFEPRVDSINVKAGPIAGGTAVTITGDHLAITRSVLFGTVPANVISASNTSVTVSSPANPLGGRVPVTVTTAGGSSPVVANAEFAYDDLQKPRFTKFKLSSSEFAASNLGGPIASAKIGSKVSFTLSKAASVKFKVARVGKKGKLKALPKKRSFTFAGVQGKNRFTFSGRPGKKALTRGRYVLLATAVDAFGRAAKTSKVKFRIVK